MPKAVSLILVPLFSLPVLSAVTFVPMHCDRVLEPLLLSVVSTLSSHVHDVTHLIEYHNTVNISGVHCDVGITMLC